MFERNALEAEIQALVDNELCWEREKTIREHIAADPQAKEFYEKIKHQKNIILDWWKNKRLN